MKNIVIIANFCRDFSKYDNGRFIYLCKELSKNNQVEIITSDFIHGGKTHREKLTEKWPFTITFLHEPGYKKNISVRRFLSHMLWGNRVGKYLKKRKKPDVIYCAVPSLTASLRTAEYCNSNNVKFVIDIQDLWPEAFHMVFDIPIVSDVLFAPFNYLANKSYGMADEIIAVSQTYVNRALQVNKKVKKGHPVFLGTRLDNFDNYAKENPGKEKNINEIWIGYCGTLGASYDLSCVIDAVAKLNSSGINNIKFIVMGDGPRKEEFEIKARARKINAVFTGSLPYPIMCGKLVACDIVVNPITHGAAGSIINKHSDYAASGLPVINTQECVEYRSLVEEYNMGFNCINNNADDVAEKLLILVNNPKLRKEMGRNARRCAEEKFDRKYTYQEIIDSITQ